MLKEIKNALHRLLGYNVRIVASGHPTIISRCWLSSDGTVRALWYNDFQIYLVHDGSVIGLPEPYRARWSPCQK